MSGLWSLDFGQEVSDGVEGLENSPDVEVPAASLDFLKVFFHQKLPFIGWLPQVIWGNNGSPFQQFGQQPFVAHSSINHFYF